MRLKEIEEKCDAETLKRIQARREELHMTQSKLATLLGFTSRSSVNRVESGSLPLSKKNIGKWAVALQTTPEYLLHISENTEDAFLERFMMRYKLLSVDERKMMMEMLETYIKYRNQ